MHTSVRSASQPLLRVRETRIDSVFIWTRKWCASRSSTASRGGMVPRSDGRNGWGSGGENLDSADTLSAGQPAT